MKKFLFIILLSFTFSQYFGGNLSLMGQFPQGEFKEQGVPWSIGGDISGMYNINDYLAFGINAGGVQYGKTSRQIPFSYFVSTIYITEETTNSLGYGNVFTRITPFQGPVQPYLEGFVGLKNLSTKTTLFNQDCTDDPATDHDDCEIASGTNLTDTAFSYGAGGGLSVIITNFVDDEGESNGELSFFLGMKYLWGNEADYLKEGDITFSDPAEGPVETFFNPSTSKTDIMQFNIGVQFKAK